MKQKLFAAIIFALGSMLTACSASQSTLSEPKAISGSGTIIISGSLPARTAPEASPSQNFAPLLGYARSNINYSPATNEYSLEISRSKSTLTVKIGEKSLEEISIDGALLLDSGSYTIERKEDNPSWYAPDEYFSSRGLSVPFIGSTERFRRGALGKQAIFASSDIIIHSSPIWTPEVGGIRLDASRLSSLADNLSIGTLIHVR